VAAAQTPAHLQDYRFQAAALLALMPPS